MLVCEAMTTDVEIVHPRQSIREAAHLMAQLDIGVLPVADGDHLVGMITDRDIAVRAVASGALPQARVGEFMTPEVKYCYADDDLDEVLDNMADLKVRRLPVLNDDKRLVGILSLSDAAQDYRPKMAGQTLSRITRPGGQHTQMPMRNGY